MLGLYRKVPFTTNLAGWSARLFNGTSASLCKLSVPVCALNPTQLVTSSPVGVTAVVCTLSPSPQSHSRLLLLEQSPHLVSLQKSLFGVNVTSPVSDQLRVPIFTSFVRSLLFLQYYSSICHEFGWLSVIDLHGTEISFGKLRVPLEALAYYRCHIFSPSWRHRRNGWRIFASNCFPVAFFIGTTIGSADPFSVFSNPQLHRPCTFQPLFSPLLEHFCTSTLASLWINPRPLASA